MKSDLDGGSRGHSAAGVVSRVLPARQRVICLTPTGTSSAAGYVWRRIFLKGRPDGQ
jgi:hypothetical protein